MAERQRERDRERQRVTERDRERQRDRETERHRERQRQRQRKTETERERGRKSPHRGKIRHGKVSRFFWIFSLFPYEMFSIKNFSMAISIKMHFHSF